LPVVEIDGRGGTRQARLEAVDRVLTATRPDIVLSARLFDAYEAVARAKQATLMARAAPRLAIAVRVYEAAYIHDAGLYRNVVDLCATDGRLLTDACSALAAIPHERLANLPGGVHPPCLSVRPRRPQEAIRIAYIGRLECEQKRVGDLVTFLECLERAGCRYQLDVVGSGPAEEALRKSLRDRVAQGRVAFRGWVAREDLYRTWLPAIDCLVHFAYTEGVTIAPREAMVHGVVPVISQFIGLRAEGQFVDEVNALTFPVGDVALAARHVVRLATEPRLLERLSAAAMVSQTGRYTHAGSMDAWAAALDGVLERAPVTGPTPAIDRRDTGRLSRLGFSPRLAHRTRQLFRRAPVYSDPGSEWPTASGTMRPEHERRILAFATEAS
jgi:glycosyltransferase involved in cell wall biosynthesis